MQFVQGIFLPKYDPTIEDVYKKVEFKKKICFVFVLIFIQTVEIDEKQYSLEILDTAGTVREQKKAKKKFSYSLLFSQEEFSAMRDLYVKNGQGFVLVYSITSQATFNDLIDIKDQIMRVKDIGSDIPLVLVGNKSDLEDERVVGKHQGESLARSFGCTFLETSAKLEINVNEVRKFSF